MKRINAIYARQSVDRADSISIESQIEFCKYELKGGSFKEYKDKGYSGKNTVRPQLQQLLTDIRRGEVEKVIVYKLDRISRIRWNLSLLQRNLILRHLWDVQC